MAMHSKCDYRCAAWQDLGGRANHAPCTIYAKLVSCAQVQKETLRFRVDMHCQMRIIMYARHRLTLGFCRGLQTWRKLHIFNSFELSFGTSRDLCYQLQKIVTRATFCR